VLDSLKKLKQKRKKAIDIYQANSNSKSPEGGWPFHRREEIVIDKQQSVYAMSSARRKERFGRVQDVSVKCYDMTWYFEFSYEMVDIQGRIYDIAESISQSPSKAAKNLITIIEKHPYSFDAYDRLAFILSYVYGKLDESIELLQRGLLRSKELFPEGFVFGKSNLPWTVMENRPFLRMYCSLGLRTMERGEMEKARKILEDMLGMNPDDNQGLREVLCSCYFEAGDVQSVLELSNKYEDDTTPAILFGRVLALFKAGRMDDAERALREAVKYGGSIAVEIMAKKHKKLKETGMDYIEMGSKKEAGLYWNHFGRYWDETVGAVEFVKSQAKKTR
jgi:tetratricopeptide (TPR) repeat protein